jgi:hypothetical protein
VAENQQCFKYTKINVKNRAEEFLSPVFLVKSDAESTQNLIVSQPKKYAEICCFLAVVQSAKNCRCMQKQIN